jgi:NAD(P)-dependent dehydrogenase (short-subunit alcohol dehydrogenase family)
VTKAWLITGCSSGFGRVLAEAVLARGDRAMLTARDVSRLADLAGRYPDRARTGRLDVTDTAEIRAVVEATREAFGGLDVLVNNAGFGLLGAVEETEPHEYRPMFEANLFGSIEMIRGALPLLRSRPGGRIVQLSSVGGISARPGFGLYSASKFAVEGLAEALAAEVEPLGLSVVIVEPGSFRTDFLGRSLRQAARRIPAYDATAGATRNVSASRDGRQPGDPARAVEVILEAVDSDKPPLRLALGADAYERIRAKLARVAADLDAWEAVATATAHRQ